jgi:hypothetical protein
VDACNPLLQAHPTWARDEHEGRRIPTSLTPVSGRLAPPLRARPRARPIWAGAHDDIHSSAQGPPGLETPTDSDNDGIVSEGAGLNELASLTVELMEEPVSSNSKRQKFEETVLETQQWVEQLNTRVAEEDSDANDF